MTWDYSEVNPFAGAGGDFAEIVAKAAPKVVAALPASSQTVGIVEQRDARAIISATDLVVSTDPPYYDNISYSDLSDYFYLWLRRSLAKVFPALFSTVVTPKAQELIATPYRHEGDSESSRRFFEEGLEKTFHCLRSLSQVESPITVYYAFKQSETDDGNEDDDDSASGATVSTGWETMLEGLVRSDFNIVGTWPVRTENATRIIATGDGGVNALASSIVLVCRPRASTARLATRKEFMSMLRQELPDALKNLQHGNIAPVDMAQSAIGPGMAVFTRYAKVIESDGTQMTVRTALGIINQVLDEVLSEQEGEFDPETRWALAWFEQFGVSEGSFGEADVLARAKNTATNGLVEAGIVRAKSGKVQLVSRTELPSGWDPTTDQRIAVWETVQHLIRSMETSGEAEAAALVNKLGGMAESARDLAYRLYSICERKKWTEEALSYNGLVIAWPELTRLALAIRDRQPPSSQQQMF